MAEHYRCGHLYGGAIEDAKAAQTIVVEDGTIAFAGPTDAAPRPAAGDEIVDYSGYFVLPGLVDLHTHLTYGNAMCEEDIDFYGSSEFRALRGVVAAQRLLAAGYTSMADPGGSNFVAVSIRDAVDAGIVVGPRINCSSQYITSHQGLTDYFPEYSVGNVKTGIGKVVMDDDSAIEAIRVQVKDGVDFVKFAMDGRHVDRDGALLAAFTLDETRRMVDECHRLGKKAVMHARGREGTLFSALAGADLIFHASWGDGACIEAMLANGCAVCPTLLVPYHNQIFTQPTDPMYHKVRPDLGSREWAAAMDFLPRAYRAGVPFMTGTDTGFAITPYGEWNAREIELFVELLGLTPAEALNAATAVSGSFLAGGEKIGRLEAGCHADFIVFDGNPLANVSLLLDKERIKHVYLAGRPVALDLPPISAFGVSDFSYKMWHDTYTQSRVAQLGPAIRHIQAAE